MEESNLQLAQPEPIEGSNDEDFSKISLRPLDLSDIDDFMVWVSDQKVSRFCIWDPYSDKEKGISLIKNVVIPHPWYRVICLNNRPIGAISVTPNSGDYRCKRELGYALGSRYWRKRIMKRAVKLVAGSIFTEWLHLERLDALVDVENVRSRRVLEKAGFKREGVLRKLKYFVLKGRTRDMVMFSLLLTDPQT
ncbi:hypothetical protein SLA2020_096900 [Shorea laevis]